VNILIVGNGFDLAHGLPTKYTHFLDYCRDYDPKNPISDNKTIAAEFAEIIEQNVWLGYFQHITPKDAEGKTWIDLEREIKRVVDAKSPFFEEEVFVVSSSFSAPFLRFLCLTEFAKENTSSLNDYGHYGDYIIQIPKVTDHPSYIQWLYTQLRAFIRAFEIYCVEHINELKDIVSPAALGYRTEWNQYDEDIRYAREQKHKLHNEKKKPNESFFEYRRRIESWEVTEKQTQNKQKALLNNPKAFLALSRFDCILSFNYTKTYQLLYGTSSQHCYIHGQAQRDPCTTNMVLGIDDALSEEEAKVNFEWVKFKKYFQRIVLKTGSEYKDWLEDGTEKHVHIVGHSLDETDHDVFREFMTCDGCRTTIYYWNEQDHNAKIEQAIRIVGRDELIKQVHGSDWTIRFVDLYGPQGLFDKRL